MYNDFDLRVVKDMSSGKVNLVRFAKRENLKSIRGYICYFKPLTEKDSPSNFVWGYPYAISELDANTRTNEEVCTKSNLQTERFSINVLKSRINYGYDNKIIIMPLYSKDLYEHPEIIGKDLAVALLYKGLRANILGKTIESDWQDMGSAKDFLPAKVYHYMVNLLWSGHANSREYNLAFSLFKNILPDLQQIIRDKVDGKTFVLSDELKNKLEVYRNTCEETNIKTLINRKKIQSEHDAAVERGEMPF